MFLTITNSRKVEKYLLYYNKQYTLLVLLTRKPWLIYLLVKFFFFQRIHDIQLSRIHHYYRKANLSRLGNLCCPDFPTENARPGQKGDPFVPGLATGTKGYLLSRLVTPTGTKGAASATWLAHPFVPVGVTNRDKRSLFFPVFLFSILFLFQLYFYISIKLMYWNSVCLISINIYIVTYIIFVLDSFHI